MIIVEKIDISMMVPHCDVAVYYDITVNCLVDL